MSLVKLLSCTSALVLAAACHEETRYDTGNTGASVQYAPTGVGQQVGTEPDRPAPEGMPGALPMGRPGANNVIGQGPSGTIGPEGAPVNAVDHDGEGQTGTTDTSALGTGANAGSAATQRPANSRAGAFPGSR